MPSDNSHQGWRQRKKLHQKERDGLAKEIVALVNAYGGHIIIGIVESDDQPKRAKKLACPLPNIYDLADTLRDSLSSIIDPPLRNLEIQPIPKDDGADDGYLVLSVPSSSSAPHGYRNPPTCYIRRDDKSEPMNMRDIQNVFWETRTRRERIDAEFAKQREAFLNFPDEQPSVIFQFTAILEHPVEIPNVYQDMHNHQFFRRVSHNSQTDLPNIAAWPFDGENWDPEPTGARLKYKQGLDNYDIGYWEIDDSGVLTVVGQTRRGIWEEGLLYPATFSKVAGWLIKLAKLISIYGNGADTNLIVSGAIRSNQDKVYVPNFERKGHSKECSLKIPKIFRPIIIPANERNKALNLIEQRIWNLFGVIAPDGASELREQAKFNDE